MPGWPVLRSFSRSRVRIVPPGWHGTVAGLPAEGRITSASAPRRCEDRAGAIWACAGPRVCAILALFERGTTMLTRRDFLRSATAVGAAGALGRIVPDAEAARLPGGSMLDLPASAAPIDTVVVMMMENRSFDHYLGWLASDETYLETGRCALGAALPRSTAARTRRYRAARRHGGRRPIRCSGRAATIPGAAAAIPTRATAGTAGRAAARPRVPRHRAAATTSSRSAGTVAEDLAFYAALSRRFTVFDRYHCSVLGPTFPNREYLHSAQSGGIKNNAFPHGGRATRRGSRGRRSGTSSRAAGVPARYYYVDLPVVALWGARLLPIASPIANFFADAAAGTLPNVVFLDPGFLGDTRTDEHPHGDVRDGQRLVQTCVKAFVESPHWERGVFFLTYDEWGGFFDHVRPPRMRDDRANGRDDENDFGQAGFRVPTRMLSPYARQQLRRPPALRPHLDPAFPRVALPGRAARRAAAGRATTGSSPRATATRTTSAGACGPASPIPSSTPTSAPIPRPRPACGGPRRSRSSARQAPPEHDLARGVDERILRAHGLPDRQLAPHAPEAVSRGLGSPPRCVVGGRERDVNPPGCARLPGR